MHKLFVYGTLREGHMRNSVLSESEFLGVKKTRKKYTMVDLSAFPGIFDEGKTSITGELYLVDDLTLQRCDMIEGHPNFYYRDRIKLQGGGKAYAYFLPKKDYDYRPVVSTGDWLKR